jgi:tRNA dimethylallyltransferase
MKKVLLLLGPTGAGKTAASLFLARRLDSEIISADSMQIYRHMDIGTAKPTPEERSAVRHHMIDVIDPWESFSTGRFIEEVRPIIDSLHKERKLPLIAGGTGLYVKAMTRGIFSGPSADWGLRKELLEDEESDPGCLYRRLAETDPEAASRIMSNDIRRIIRALEVSLASGSSISEMQAEQTVRLPYDFVKIGLTRDREELYRIINARVDWMFEAGLVEEVKHVVALINAEVVKSGRMTSSGLPDFRSVSSLQAIGYKELIRHLDGSCSLKETIELVRQRSRNYAKRQFTWFRKEADIEWIDITGIFDAEKICELILKSVGKFTNLDLGIEGSL